MTDQVSSSRNRLQPRYKLGLLDSESRVLTIEAQELVFQSNKILVYYSHHFSVTFDLVYFADRIDCRSKEVLPGHREGQFKLNIHHCLES